MTNYSGYADLVVRPLICQQTFFSSATERSSLSLKSGRLRSVPAKGISTLHQTLPATVRRGFCFKGESGLRLRLLIIPSRRLTRFALLARKVIHDVCPVSPPRAFCDNTSHKSRPICSVRHVQRRAFGAARCHRSKSPTRVTQAQHRIPVPAGPAHNNIRRQRQKCGDGLQGASAGPATSVIHCRRSPCAKVTSTETSRGRLTGWRQLSCHAGGVSWSKAPK